MFGFNLKWRDEGILMKLIYGSSSGGGPHSIRLPSFNR